MLGGKIEAQEKLNRAQNEQFKVESYKPPVRTQDASEAPKETAQPKAKEKYEPKLNHYKEQVKIL